MSKWRSLRAFCKIGMLPEKVLLQQFGISQVGIYHQGTFKVLTLVLLPPLVIALIEPRKVSFLKMQSFYESRFNQPSNCNGSG